ncbi:MAG TPA: dethiobiotin synthase [Puia sp.]|nr:dethiobiotin synthase [Puia sp.]
MPSIFITGIGTDVGKTIVAAILAEALEADYWKPVQAGNENGTDSDFVRANISNSRTKIHPEAYLLGMAASPHISAKEEGKKIGLDEIKRKLKKIEHQNDFLIIEGAGGLLVPLNEEEFVIDLISVLEAKVIIVSRNYLGSINHSLLTAKTLASKNISVMGWIFNDHYMDYEEEIACWSGIPKIASIPFEENPDKRFILEQAKWIRPQILKLLSID